MIGYLTFTDALVPCVGQVGTTQFLWGHNGHDVDRHPGILLFKFLVCVPPMEVVCVSAYKLNARNALKFPTPIGATLFK
jgi:hypothetical protein